VRRAVLLGAVLLAGCGSNVGDPGDPQALRVFALAQHGRAIDDRVGAAGRTLLSRQASAREARLTLQELLGEAALLHEDVTSVPFGVPGRVPALEGARELREAASYLHSYASGHPAGLPLARVHLAAATRALAGAARALRPSLTEVQGPQLAHLEAPAPALPSGESG
jgi:hypothetical protein